MSPHEALLSRLLAGDPGWPEWRELLQLVKSLDFTLVKDPYQGVFLVSGERLVFRGDEFVSPTWLPPYVQALVGMKAMYYESAGGYADYFDGTTTEPGSLFASGGADAMMAFPEIAIPDGTYPFQSNYSGALFHLNERLEIVYADADDATIHVLDSLDAFTRKNIRQALTNEPWFDAYKGFTGGIVD